MPKWLLVIIGFCLVVALNVFLYFPSFYNIARADQLVYLIETSEIDGLEDLLTYSYSYGRTRILMSGDRQLFRPVFFSILALEKWMFGYNFFLWQLAAFAFHVFILGLLLRLLWLIKACTLSVVFVMLFSVLYGGSDMVMWHHVQGYQVFVILLLLAMICLRNYMESGHRRRRYIAAMTIYLTAACFAIEFGVIVCIALTACIWIQRWRIFEKEKPPYAQKLSYFSNHPLLLLIPAIVFMYVNFFDYAVHLSAGEFVPAVSDPIKNIEPLKGIVQFGLLIGVILIYPLVPMFYHMIPEERYQAVLVNMKDFLQWSSVDQKLVIANLLLIAMALVLGVWWTARLVRLKNKPPPKTPGPFNPGKSFAVLNAIFIVSYLGVIVVYRTIERSIGYLSGSMYHFYILGLFLVIMVYALLSFQSSRGQKADGVFKGLALTVMIGALLLNGFRVYRLGEQSRERYEPWQQYINSLQDFVRSYRSEPGFSYDVIDRKFERPIRIRMGDPPDATDIEGYAGDYFFRRYIDHENPNYYVVFRKDKGLQVFTSREFAEDYAAQEDALGEL